MMLGHLTIAGIAEFVLTGGVVAFLQRTDPALLAVTAGTGVRVEPGAATAGSPGSLRPLWVALGLLLVLTPLGLMASGSAWGEWSASQLADPAARHAIAAASLHHAPPLAPPAGLERLATVWTAPFPEYAPRFFRSRALGYLLSAMFGAGLVLLATMALATLLRARRRGSPDGDTVIT
jgi:cobalt/nickel transport system permease protein